MAELELTKMVEKAKRRAVEAHAGQKDKAGEDYFTAHISVVVRGVNDDPVAEAVAYLHDTVEDTTITMEDIRAEFPIEVANAVDVLTHRKKMSYAEYIWRVHQNPIATKVKLSDLRSNMDLTRLPYPLTQKDLLREAKYLRAYKMLDGRVSVTAVNPYALYDYLLASGWVPKEEKKFGNNTPIILTPLSGTVTITVPLDMSVTNYDTLMRHALDKLSLYEGKELESVLKMALDWKPECSSNMNSL